MRGDTMQGKRVPVVLPDEAGTYAKDSKTGSWYGVTPNGMLCNLKNHEVTEHDDGTITVSPSILVRSSCEEWHGFLERGVWREA